MPTHFRFSRLKKDARHLSVLVLLLGLVGLVVFVVAQYKSSRDADGGLTAGDRDQLHETEVSDSVFGSSMNIASTDSLAERLVGTVWQSHKSDHASLAFRKDSKGNLSMSDGTALEFEYSVVENRIRFVLQDDKAVELGIDRFVLVQVGALVFLTGEQSPDGLVEPVETEFVNSSPFVLKH